MSTERPDPYATLGLTPQASADQIRRAFRNLMRRNHPDTRQPAQLGQSEDSSSLLQEVIAAYAILGDPQRRADYDASGSTPTSPPAPDTRPVPPHSHTGQPPIRVGPVRWHRRWS